MSSSSVLLQIKGLRLNEGRAASPKHHSLWGTGSLTPKCCPWHHCGPPANPHSLIPCGHVWSLLGLEWLFGTGDWRGTGGHLSTFRKSVMPRKKSAYFPSSLRPSAAPGPGDSSVTLAGPQRWRTRVPDLRGCTHALPTAPEASPPASLSALHLGAQPAVS